MIDRMVTDESGRSMDGSFRIENGVLKGYRGNAEAVCIPDGVTAIGNCAFTYCDSMKSIVLPGSIRSIGAHAFEQCPALTSVLMMEGVLEIGDSAFRHCDSLRSIVLPMGLISIGDYAFTECISLSEIDVPDSTISIGVEAFARCRSLNRVILSNKIRRIRLRTFCDCSALEDIEFPAGMVSIDAGAFSNCRALQRVLLPQTLTTIGDAGFLGCSSLERIVLPKNMVSIGYDAFGGCGAMVDLRIEENQNFRVSEGVIYNADMTRVICASGSRKSVTLPEGVTTIAKRAFQGWGSLTCVILPRSMTMLEEGAFYGCHLLQCVVQQRSGWEWEYRKAFDWKVDRSILIPEVEEGPAGYQTFAIASMQLEKGLTNMKVYVRPGAHRILLPKETVMLLRLDDEEGVIEKQLEELVVQNDGLLAKLLYTLPDLTDQLVRGNLECLQKREFLTGHDELLTTSTFDRLLNSAQRNGFSELTAILLEARHDKRQEPGLDDLRL